MTAVASRALRAAARLLVRAWQEISYPIGEVTRLNRMNTVIWRWQDRRRAVRLDGLASRADSAGLTATDAREAAARARLRAAS
jgi:hypothetical protein